MADINLNFGTDDLKGLEKLLEELRKLVKEIKTNIEKTGTVTMDEATRLKKLQAEALKVTNEYEKQKRAAEKRAESARVEENSIKSLKNKVTELTKEYENAGTAVNRMTAKSKLDEAKKQLDTLKNSTNEWSKALGSFQFKFNALGNIAGNVFGSISSKITHAIGQMTSFSKVIESTDKSSDAFARTIGGIVARFDALNRAIASGNLDDFFDRMSEAAKGARDYADALDYISDKQRSLTVLETDTLQRQAELTEIWKNPDAKYSVKEQIAAVSELLQIQKDLAIQNTKLAETSYKAEIDRIKSKTGLTDEEIMTYIKLYDQQEKLVELGRRLTDIDKAKATVNQLSGKVAIDTNKALSERESLLAKEAEILGVDVEAIRIYSRMINNFTEKDRQAVVDKYKAWKEADVSYILENKRLLASLGTLNEEFIAELKKNAKDPVSILPIPKPEEFETLLAEVKEMAEDWLVEEGGLIDAEYRAFVRSWQDRTFAVDQETKKQAALVQQGKMAELQAYSDFFSGLQALAGQNTIVFKLAAIAEATINMWKAAMSALAEEKGGAKKKLAAYAIILATGLKTLASLKSVKVKQYAEGGEIGGKLHSQGGTMIEAERGEFVVKRSAYQKNKQLINALNAEDSAKIALALRQDKRIEQPKEDYTKKMYEFLKNQENYGELNDSYIIQKGNVKWVIPKKK
jgi:uncharacterized coiled-coil DUF342 family protein